jgi:hypothetical protein
LRLQLLGRYCFAAEGTTLVLADPTFDAGFMELMTFVARQGNHFFFVFKFLLTYHTFVLFSLAVVLDFVELLEQEISDLLISILPLQVPVVELTSHHAIDYWTKLANHWTAAR